MTRAWNFLKHDRLSQIGIGLAALIIAFVGTKLLSAQKLDRLYACMDAQTNAAIIENTVIPKWRTECGQACAQYFEQSPIMLLTDASCSGIYDCQRNELYANATRTLAFKLEKAKTVRYKNLFAEANKNAPNATPELNTWKANQELADRLSKGPDITRILDVRDTLPNRYTLNEEGMKAARPILQDYRRENAKADTALEQAESCAAKLL